MMPPINEIGEAAAALVALHLPSVMKGVGDGIAKKSGADTWDAFKAIYDELFEGKTKNGSPEKTALQEALAQVAENPEPSERQQLLQEKLIALLEQEQTLAQSLSDILTTAKLLPPTQNIATTQGEKSQAIIGDNATVTQKNIQTYIEKQYQTPPKPETTGKVNNLPLEGSGTFVGREQTLKDLHVALSPGNTVAITAIQGMGGIGKTELARQYAKQYEASYPGGVCWLRARDLDVASQIVEFAQVYLQLAPPEGLDLTAQVAYCWTHWPISASATEGTENRVLVVYDDVTNYQSVAAALPPNSDRFQVLMTTRDQHLATTVESFSIKELSEAASLDLLRQIVGGTQTDDELSTAKAVCAWLGYLPLGLELVGQYLKQKLDVGFGKLQERLKAQRTEARPLQNKYDGMTAKLGVVEAFELSWQTLADDEQQLACWLSTFALAPIPWSLASTPATDEDEEDWEDGRDKLVKLSLLRREKSGDYQLHQLLREYFLAKLTQRKDSDELIRAYCQVMVAIAKQMPQSPTRELIVRVTPAIPHIAETTMQWQDWLEDDDLILPFVAITHFYWGQGTYSKAEPHCEQCLTVTRSRFGNEHSDVALSLNNLAFLYSSQGRYGEAEPLYIQSLKLRRKLLGHEHIDVTASLHNLAGLYSRQGRYEEAEPLYIQSLKLRRKLLGHEHIDITASLNNLAGLYESQGRYKKAESLYTESLKLSRKLLGDEHQNIATNLNNLALIYSNQGQYEKAEAFYTESLELSRKLLSDGHPNIAISLNNLAFLYSSQGRYKEAEPLYTQSLELSRKLLGDEHPNIATNLNNLALLYSDQGQYEQAEPLCIKALKLSRKLLGDEHPDVAASLNNLACLYKNQGRYEQAESLYLEAGEIAFNRLGPNHPKTQALIKSFTDLLTTVIQANKQTVLSNNPLTQQLLKIVQASKRQAE